MTTDQTILILDQVKEIADINIRLLNLAKDITPAHGQPVINVVKKLLEACDMINQIGANNPPVDIKFNPICNS